MKHVVQGMTYIFFIVMTVVIIMTIYGRVDRKSNLQSSLQSAVKGAVDEVSTRGGYSSDNLDDLKADFVARLCTNLDISGDTSDAGDSTAVHDDNLALQIDFTDSSIEEGLLGVHVTERITYPHGKQSVIEASAVVILEDEGDKQQCKITYLLTEGTQEQLGFPSPYKVYTAVKDEGAKKSLIPTPSSSVEKWVPVDDYPDYGIKAGSAMTAEEIEKIPVPGDITFIDDGSITPTEVPYEAVSLKECIPNTYDADKVIDFDKGNHDFVAKLVPGALVRYNGSVYEVAEEPYKGSALAGLTVRPAVPKYDGFISPKQSSLYLVKEDELANNVLYFFFDRQKYNLTVHVEDNIVSATADVGKYKEIGCTPNDTTVIGSIYYGTEINFTVNPEDGFSYSFSGDTDSEKFIMPGHDAEIWIHSKESEYVFRLNPNGGIFYYTEDANGQIKTKDSSDKSTLSDMMFVHRYNDDWTLPWVDSDNKTKSNGNNGIKNQSTSLMYRDGYIFEGWTDVAPSKDVYNNYDTMPLEAFKEYVTSKGGHFYNDVAEVSTKDYSEDNVSTKGIKNKGEIRLYAKWRLQYFVVRYHSDAYEDTPIESDMNVPKGKTAIDTNNGKFYEMAKDGTYPSVWLADNTLGEGRIRTALGFDENSNADFSSWTVGGDGNPDKDNFSIGVTVADGEKKEEDLYTELDGSDRKHLKAMEGSNNVPNGTVTVPSGLAGYISHSSDAKAEWVDGKYVMVIDLYPTYTYAIKVNLHGNAEEHGVTYESSFYAHYAVTSAYSVPDMKSYNNSAATFKGVWDIARLGSDNDFDGSLNPYLLKLGISEKRRCKYYPKENETPYSYSDFYWSANGGNTLDLYAQWNVKDIPVSPDANWHIHYEANGGTGNMSDQTIPCGVSANLEKNNFTRQYYSFIGWKYNGKTSKIYMKHHVINKTTGLDDIDTYDGIYTVPSDGYYLLECYGASTSYNPHKGGYTYMTCYLKKGQKLYCHVGGVSWTDIKGCHAQIPINGGGYPPIFTDKDLLQTALTGGYAYSAGGGATDIRLDGDSINNQIVVAGGAAGATRPDGDWHGENNDAFVAEMKRLSAIYCGPGNDTQTTWTRYRGGSGIQTAAGWGGFSGGGGGYYGGAVTTDNGGHSYGGTGYIASTVNGYDAGGQIVNGDNRADSQGSHIEITPIFVDQQSVKDLVGKDQTATLTAIWSTTAAKFFKLNVSSVSDDIAKLNGIDDLIGKEYYEVGGLSKNITLPDLGKENGFMGWLDNMNGSIVRSVSFVPGSSGIYSYTALWADHYAVSVWGINHDDGLNSGGIVFGSAMNTTNNDYDISYIGNSPSRHVHDGECIHNDYVQGGWARVIYYCQNDPERYRKCMEYGCTVPVYFYGSNGDFQYGKSIYTALTKLGGDTGIGDGATQIDYAKYQSKGHDDIDHNNGGWRNAEGGKNKEYLGYAASDMPDTLSTLYSALCNSDLKSYMSDSTVRYATQSKSYVKGLWDSSAAGGRMAVTAPVTINSDGTTTQGTETIGANFIHDLRNGVDSSYKDVEVYNYATISGQKFFLPSAHEIFGSQTDYNWCRMFQQGYDYGDTTYVLDYLDGEQYEKFKDYSFNGNLFIASYGTKYGIKKDNARLNTKNSYGTRSVVLRTPGSSLTRARVTYLYSYGGLNTAGFTTQDCAVTPCFRIK